MKLEVLITVKTYPLPSTVTSIREHVCTAGVLQDGTFVRLYPIDYRYRPYSEWYAKYDIVTIDAEKRKKGDSRPESYSPVANARFELVGHLDTKRNWEERKKWVLAKDTNTMCELQAQDQSVQSLAIIKPFAVDDFIYEEAERQWKPEWEQLFKQELLFGPKQKPLEKIPFKFSYIYRCSPDCKRGHTMMIEDWEVGQLFRNMKLKYGDEKKAAEMVKQRFFSIICAPEIDTHFFVGTVLQHGTWVILGVFWPKKDK